MKRNQFYCKNFLEYRKGYRISENTLKRDRYYLNRLITWLGDTNMIEMTGKKILEYLEYIRTLKNNRGEFLKPESINVEVSLLKVFFKYLYKSEVILNNPMEDLEIKQKRTQKEREIFSEKDINLFLDSISINTPSEQRDRALFELMYSSGLRVAEITGLKIENVNLDDRICFITRKGGKEAFVPFSETALIFLLKYINNGRKKHLKKIRSMDEKSLLFLNTNGRITWKALNRRFKKYLNRCELEKKGYTHHSIRHATATQLLSSGASIRYVQELLGHETLKTTQIYTRPQIENIKAKYRTYHPRENEYFKEVDEEYIRELEKMRKQLIFQGKEQRKKEKRKEKRILKE